MPNTNFQFAGYPIQGADLALYNFGGADIAAGLGVLIDTANTMSAQNKEAPGVALPAVAGSIDASLGVTVDTLKAGAIGRVRFLGAVPMTADSPITAGDYITVSSAAGKLGFAKTAAKGSGIVVLGEALDTVADGDTVLVWLFGKRTA